jgi:hypothetical protein
MNDNPATNLSKMNLRKMGSYDDDFSVKFLPGKGQNG